MSLHDIRWEQGAAQWAFAGLKHFTELPRDQLFRDGLAEHRAVRGLRRVAQSWCSGSSSPCSPAESCAAASSTAPSFLLPILIPGIVIGAIWKLDVQPRLRRRSTSSSALVGLPGRDWLGEKALAFASVVVVDIWHWTPFVFLLLLAGLESLPQDVYEAAKIDGASAWQELRYVTLPMMLPTIAVTLVFRLIVVVQGLRRGLSPHRRRAGHRDRGGELHDLPALLHRGPHGLRLGDVGRSCCSC